MTMPVIKPIYLRFFEILIPWMKKLIMFVGFDFSNRVIDVQTIISFELKNINLSRK